MGEREEEVRKAVEVVDLLVDQAYNLTKVLYHFHKFHVELARLLLMPPFIGRSEEEES